MCLEVLVIHPRGHGVQPGEMRVPAEGLQPSVPLLPGFLVDPPFLVELIGLLYDAVGDHQTADGGKILRIKLRVGGEEPRKQKVVVAAAGHHQVVVSPQQVLVGRLPDSSLLASELEDEDQQCEGYHNGLHYRGQQDESGGIDQLVSIFASNPLSKDCRCNGDRMALRGWRIRVVTVSVVVMLTPMLTGFAPLQANPIHSALTPTLPSGIVAYVPITITNSQLTPTRAAFQQLVKVDSAAYADWEAPNLQNVEFFSLNGTVITSWLESGNSSRSRSTIYWLNLGNPIPGGSKVTVYMGFASTGSNLLNDRTTGEAPQLSPGYGEYDDGARVFLYYSDFAGSSLPTGWTSAPQQHLTNVSYSVNNGLTFPSQPACCGSIDYNRTYSSGTMIDVDATI